MSETAIDLSELTVHPLNVAPDEDESAIESHLHATFGGLEESILKKLVGKKVEPTELRATVEPTRPTDAGTAVGEASTE